MPHHQGRAVTHADVAPAPRSTDLGSKTAASLMALTVLSGLFCFILCLIAEATRSKARWVSGNSQCMYSGSGRTPLMCGAIAFGGLAVTMVVEHVYMLIAFSKAPPQALITWDSDDPYPAKKLTCLAAFFFVATWVCFGVGEILLLVGLSVETGHLSNWNSPRPSCLTLRQGLFSVAGIFCLLAVLLAAALYLTALRAHHMSQHHQGIQRQILEASVLYASPPASPRVAALAREDPVINTADHPTPLRPTVPANKYL